MVSGICLYNSKPTIVCVLFQLKINETFFPTVSSLMFSVYSTVTMFLSFQSAFPLQPSSLLPKVLFLYIHKIQNYKLYLILPAIIASHQRSKIDCHLDKTLLRMMLQYVTVHLNHLFSALKHL